MDSGDVDFYVITAPAAGGFIDVEIENQSDSLRPYITAFGPNRQQLSEQGGSTPGQHFAYAQRVGPGGEYIFRVSSYGGSTGAYQLRLVPRPADDDFEPSNGLNEAVPISRLPERER